MEIMTYRVKNYRRNSNFAPGNWDLDVLTATYHIDAASAFDAAVMALAYSNGYTGKEVSPIPFDDSINKTYPARTIKERLEDMTKYNGKRMDGADVYHCQMYGLMLVYEEA